LTSPAAKPDKKVRDGLEDVLRDWKGYFYNRTGEIPELSRPVSAAEHQEAQDIARRFGLTGQSG
jgi:hypothetical protein